MKKTGMWLLLGLLVVSLLAGCGGSPVDQYEKLIDEMLPLMKKAQTGDLGAAQDIAKLQEKVQELYEKLLEADLSEEDQERLLKAAEKLATVF
jgi:hypothetical protein